MGLSAKSRFDCKDLARKKRCFYPESDSEQTSLLEINPVWSSVTYISGSYFHFFILHCFLFSVPQILASIQMKTFLHCFANKIP